MKEKRIYTKRLLSSQLKKAILLAFKEARNYGSNNVSSKFLLYAILKVDNTLANKSINNLYKHNSLFNSKVNKVLTKCQSEFKISKKNSFIAEKENILTFSRSTRRLLFVMLRSVKTKNNISVINTFQVFNCLIRNKSLRKWIKQLLID